SIFPHLQDNLGDTGAGGQTKMAPASSKGAPNHGGAVGTQQNAGANQSGTAMGGTSKAGVTTGLVRTTGRRAGGRQSVIPENADGRRVQSSSSTRPQNHDSTGAVAVGAGQNKTSSANVEGASMSAGSTSTSSSIRYSSTLWKQQPDAALAYRLYAIWHLRQLKLLDGVPISTGERQNAKGVFAGRLTMEVLEETLGPTPACFYVRSIDLSSLKLRDLGSLLQDEVFPSLRELVLDENPLGTLLQLGPCTKIVILKCNRTKMCDLHLLAGSGGVGTGTTGKNATSTSTTTSTSGG
ncbi:unnamed protein product, partial [Amoebophrya sp. A25]